MKTQVRKGWRSVVEVGVSRGRSWHGLCFCTKTLAAAGDRDRRGRSKMEQPHRTVGKAKVTRGKDGAHTGLLREGGMSHFWGKKKGPEVCQDGGEQRELWPLGGAGLGKAGEVCGSGSRGIQQGWR